MQVKNTIKLERFEAYQEWFNLFMRTNFYQKLDDNKML